MRYVALDGLRGIAALTVVMSHFFGMIPDMPLYFKALAQTPLHIFWDGAAAVDLFFVLSGFCVALPYVANNERKIRAIPFVIRRGFRLYPAYLAALLVCFVLKSYYICPPPEYMSEWGRSFWLWDSIGSYTLIKVLTLITNFDSRLLDPPSWSLVIEMRMAFILPLMFYIFRRLNLKKSILLAVGLVSLSFLNRDVYGYFTFSYLFAFGIMLAKYRAAIADYVENISAKQLKYYLLLSFILYEGRFPFRKLLFNDGSEAVFHLATGLGSVLIIALLFRKDLGKYLSGKLGAFLGQISYSIYLLHFPLLLILWGLNLSSLIILILTMALGLLLAYLVYRFIELPLVTMGRYISDRW